MNDLIVESNEQFRKAWTLFAERIPGGEARELDGVVAVFSNVPVAFFNIILLKEPVSNLDSLAEGVRSGIEYGSSSPHPWLFALCTEWMPKGAETVCREMGLHPVLPLVGMAADRLLEPVRRTTELEFRRAGRDADVRLMSEINVQAYGMPESDVDSLTVPGIWQEDAFAFVAFHKEAAVSVSATFIVDERLYVGWVATLPDFQKKGYGEAVMRYSLRRAEAATGLRRTVLHATPAGAPLYRQMGYQTVASFTLYSNQPPPVEDKVEKG
jgi:GNAT superfamily N-acetyltransferase